MFGPDCWNSETRVGTSSETMNDIEFDYLTQPQLSAGLSK